MRFLCLSDIHGNLDALTAVLATAEKRSFQKLLVAGDIVFPGPASEAAAPLETWRRLVAAGAQMVQGVSDRAIATLDISTVSPTNEQEKRQLERLKRARAELGDVILQRIKRLPTHLRFPLEDGGELILVHGSPSDAGEQMSHDMSDEELWALLGDDPADVIVCGMSHTPFERVIADVRIINVGSVGEAAGQPRVAHAVWIDSVAGGVTVEPIIVPLEEDTPRVRRVATP